MAKHFLVVGLGNPGAEYEKSRHNVGFMVVDELLGNEHLTEDSKKRAATADVRVGNAKVTLVKPLTFMNKSGEAVAALTTYYKIKPEQIIVVHDEIDLPMGRIKISQGRGSAGHRGVHSVLRSLKTKEIIRVRVGVASTTSSGKTKKPKGEQKVLSHLMGDFKNGEDALRKKMMQRAAEAVTAIIERDVNFAMNTFN